MFLHGVLLIVKISRESTLGNVNWLNSTSMKSEIWKSQYGDKEQNYHQICSSNSHVYIVEKYRIIECFGLEGTFRGHLAQLPCSEQGHLQLDQVAQSPVQLSFECFQGWGLHYLLWATSSGVSPPSS